MFSGFSQYWQADSRPTAHEWRQDLRANGYRPRSFPQSDTAQVRTHPDCDGHPADTVSSVCGDAVRTFEARKDGQGGAFQHAENDA